MFVKVVIFSEGNVHHLQLFFPGKHFNQKRRLFQIPLDYSHLKLFIFVRHVTLNIVMN